MSTKKETQFRCNICKNKEFYTTKQMVAHYRRSHPKAASDCWGACGTVGDKFADSALDSTQFVRFEQMIEHERLLYAAIGAMLAPEVRLENGATKVVYFTEQLENELREWNPEFSSAVFDGIRTHTASKQQTAEQLLSFPAHR